MSCCGNNNTNYYARVSNNRCDDLFHSNHNNDRNCFCGTDANSDFRKRLKRLINEKAIITVDGEQLCVIICEVCCCFVKAINYRANRVVYFNINRINSVEDILPR